jgi:tungstate transport system ATP-binding protein
MEEVLLASELQVTRGNRTILEIPYLAIKPGEVMAIIGPNGAGKSTLLQALSYLFKPTKGEVLFHGQPCRTEKSLLSARRRMATVFQDSFLLDGSVFFNVAAGLHLRGCSSLEIKTKTNYWLERFGIANFANRHVRGLSGGEAQRVSLARAFAVEPEVLFLDEPFTSLDAPTKVLLMDELKLVIRNTNVTTIFVTHDAEGIPFYADRLLVLEQGRIDQDTSLLQILKNPATPFVRAFFRHILAGSSLAESFKQNAKIH